MSADSKVIYLVQNDTRPLLTFYLTNEVTGLPVDLTAATAKLYVSRVGSSATKDTLIGQLLVGNLEEDGLTVDVAPPYNVPGAGGGVQFPMNPTTLDTVGSFDAEIEVTFSDGGLGTVYDLYRLKVRRQRG